jgi:putative heme-binding domain-containing protein
MRVFLTVLLLLVLWPRLSIADETMDALVGVLLTNDDPQLDADILKGVRDGLATTRTMEPPKGWSAVEKRLMKSPNAEVRDLANLLALKFGSQASMESYRRQVLNDGETIEIRCAALRALLEAKAAGVAGLAKRLLDVPGMRVEAIRALGEFDDADIVHEVIRRYPRLENLDERRAALNLLVSRPAHAGKLLDAVEARQIPSAHLTADLLRQLRGMKAADLNARVAQVWGVVRDSPVEKQAEIARYKKLLTAGPARGDAERGRFVFNMICGQCHTLFGEGGKVGPDITGSNRSDLDYLLHNILDPNAEIPNDYRPTNLELKDERSLTGIVTRQDSEGVTIVTAAETLTISRDEIATMRQSELSMMPEGLLQALNEQQVRDLIAHLRR